MVGRRARLFLGMAALAGVWLISSAHGQCTIEEVQKFFASDGEDGNEFGHAVAVDGNIAIIGAPWDIETGEIGNGSIYVFRKTAGNWAQSQKIKPNIVGWFGDDVSVSGDVIAVGTRLGGKVYLFRDLGGTFVLEQFILDPEDNPTNAFGLKVAVAEGVLVVGTAKSQLAGTNAGAAYVYRDVGGAWSLEETLIASDAQDFDLFGTTVATDGSIIAVGAPNDDDVISNSGSVYMFRDTGASWIEEGELKANDPIHTSDFGSNGVDVDGDLVVVGAEGIHAAYVHRFDGIAWVQEQKLTQDSSYRFGTDVAVSGDRIVVSSREELSWSGAAYVFHYLGEGWVLDRRLVASDSAPNSYFGFSVALDSTSALIGNGTQQLRGAVYSFAVDDLALDAVPDIVTPGENLTLTACGGLPGQPVLLAVVAAYGTPIFLSVTLGTFDAAGMWQLAGPAPSLPPGTIEIQSFGISLSGRVRASNREAITFQM